VPSQAIAVEPVTPGIGSDVASYAVLTKGLTKLFAKRTAVDRLSLEIPRGCISGFVGPNGAGKTTTLRMLLGLVRPSAGDGAVLGHPLSDAPRYLRRVGALIEGPTFYPTLTGRANLEVLARRDDERDAADLDAIAGRLRASADAKRRQADRLAEEAAFAAREATAAEQAADAAEKAAGDAHLALDS